ncbi:MAG: hypothetical protein ACE5JV_03705, partial [Nitrososphaerales archaeon]
VDPAFNGIVKLASLLQKALDTGKSNYVEMSEVSRYLSYHVKTQVDDSTRYLNEILNNCGDDDDNHSKHLMKNLFKFLGELSDIALNGYEKLVSANGNISKNKLEELILIDTEITNSMKLIKNLLMSSKGSSVVKDQDLDEIENIAGDIRRNISERTNLVGQQQ